MHPTPPRSPKLHGPQSAFAQELHAEKYRGEGESFREAMQRIASALKDDDLHYRSFREVLLDMRFLPAGRVQAAMGSTRQTTPYNCFVSGTIEDSFVEGQGSIMKRAEESAATMRLGGGIGYDFSTLRPSGATIKKLNSKSSGPLAFMEIYDAICRCVASSSNRRGAQMGVMRVDHPDIEAFVRSKQNQTRFRGFNISVAVTDAFMEALIAGRPFQLKFNGEVYKEVNPLMLWETIMRSTWDWAEPGVLFIDRINAENNLAYCETIAATNPCGEQPLPPYGACLLGSFNLTKYATPRSFDLQGFVEDIPIVVRSMDNIIDRAIYPLWEHQREAQSKRRMGLGITGLANALEAQGTPYGSADFLTEMQQILIVLRDKSYEASIELAREKGPFPMLDRAKYLESPFIKRLPKHIRDGIAKHGIRNSHLISIAPCGTISMTADNVSSGLEPVWAYDVERQVVMADGPRLQRIEDYGAAHYGVRGRTSADVTAQEHLAVLKAAVPFIDSSISKTCNVPHTTTWEDFKDLYLDAWRAGCKGLTTFTVGGHRDGLMVVAEGDAQEADTIRGLSPTSDEIVSACQIDTETGRRECD